LGGASPVRSRSTIVALACACAILALGPLVLTLLRAEDYSSSTEISLADPELGRHLPGTETFIGEPLELRDLQREVVRQVDWLEQPDELPDYVDVRVSGGPERRSFVIVARGPSPGQAQELARSTAEHVTEAAETAAQFVLARELQTLKDRVRENEVPASELELARVRRRVFQDSVETRARIFSESPSPATLAKERPADRLLGALPGERPLRPNPLWAGLAGVALALALLTWVLLLGSTDRREQRPAPG
jgi:hypothetical protein